MTAPSDTITHPCPTCRKPTAHVRRFARDKRRSHEAPAVPREILRCMDCGETSEFVEERR